MKAETESYFSSEDSSMLGYYMSLIAIYTSLKNGIASPEGDKTHKKNHFPPS